MADGKMSMKKTKEETAKWTGLFLNDMKTREESLVFVKRMTVVAVSSITYFRGIFPEDAYRSRYLEDLCIKVLCENCRNLGATAFVKCMMGCFDALEKQYLQILFIGVCTNPDEPNRFIESYHFKFRYTVKGPEMDILRNNGTEMQVTLEDTKKASVLLIRKLFLLMQNLDALPNNTNLTMRLYYYDDITPADYHPPGFKEGECGDLSFEGVAVRVKVGEVESPFHTLKVAVLAEQGRVEKLQKGSYIRETKQVSPEKELEKDPPKKIHKGEALPSEDESAQFKKSTGHVAKRIPPTRKLARKKRRI